MRKVAGVRDNNAVKIAGFIGKLRWRVTCKVSRVLGSYRGVVLKPVNGPTKMSISGCWGSLCIAGELYVYRRLAVRISLGNIFVAWNHISLEVPQKGARTAG